MKFPLASLVVLLAATCCATAVPLTSDSPAGKRLLSKAIRIHNHHHGEEEEEEGRALKNDDNYYTAWMTNYSFKFDGCHSVPQFERDEGMRSVLLAQFKLCPSDSCGRVSLAVITPQEVPFGSIHFL